MQSVSLGGNKDSRRWYQRTARTFAKENKRGKETKQRDGMRMKKKTEKMSAAKKGKNQPVRQTRWENLFISTDQYSLVWPVLSINLYGDAPESHCMPQSFICCVAHDLSRSFIFFSSFYSFCYSYLQFYKWPPLLRCYIFIFHLQFIRRPLLRLVQKNSISSPREEKKRDLDVDGRSEKNDTWCFFYPGDKSVSPCAVHW